MATFRTWPSATVSLNNLNDETDAPASLATAHLKVSDTDDATYLRQEDDRTPECNAYFNADSDIPPGTSVETIDTVSLDVRVQLQGTYGNDTLELYAQIYEADGTTPLVDPVFVASAAGLTTGVDTDISIDFTGVVTDVTRWTNNQLRLYWTYSKAGGPDNIYLAVKEVDFHGEYTPTTNYLALANVEQNDNEIEAPLLRKYFRHTYVDVPFGLSPHILVAKDVESTGSVSSSSIGFPLEPLALDQTNSVEPVEAERIHELGVYFPDTLNQSSEIEAPYLGQERDLEAADVEQVSSLLSVELGQNHPLIIWAMSERPLVDKVEVRQTLQLLWPKDVEQVSRVEPVEIEQDHDTLGVRDVEQNSVVDPIEIFHFQWLKTAPILWNGSVQPVEIGHDHSLTIHDLTQVSSVAPAALEQEAGLTVLPLEQTNSVTPGAITATFLAQPAEVEQVSSVEPVALTQDHPLGARDLEQTNSVEPVALEQEAALAVLPLEQTNSVEPVAVELSVTLTPKDLDQTNSVTPVELIGGHLLITRPVAQTNEVTPVKIGVEIDLGARDVEQTNSVEPVAIEQDHWLAAGALRQTNSVQPVAIDYIHGVDAADVEQVSSVEPVEITLARGLVAADLEQTNSVDPVAITQPMRQLGALPLEQANSVEPAEVGSTHTVEVANLLQVGSVEPGAFTIPVVLEGANLLQDSVITTVAIYVGRVQSRCPWIREVSDRQLVSDVTKIQSVLEYSVEYRIVERIQSTRVTVMEKQFLISELCGDGEH